MFVLYDGTCAVYSAHPLVSPLIHLRHRSIALPMGGVPKMCVAVGLPHFTSPGSNGGQIGIFPYYLRRHSKNKPTRVHLH